MMMMMRVVVVVAVMMMMMMMMMMMVVMLTIAALTWGRYFLLAGHKGHVALLDGLRMDLLKELHLGETIRDATVRLRSHYGHEADRSLW
jgi:hypothetical protein